jgi:hypothetical protein
VAGDLPCADTRYLGALKRSAEYRALRPQLAGEPPHPVFDSWFDDGFHFFTFVLTPSPDVEEGEGGGLAVFAMHDGMPQPVSAVTVIPTADGDAAEITNLREPGGSYIAPLRPLPDEDEGSPDHETPD